MREAGESLRAEAAFCEEDSERKLRVTGDFRIRSVAEALSDILGGCVGFMERVRRETPVKKGRSEVVAMCLAVVEELLGRFPAGGV